MDDHINTVLAHVNNYLYELRRQGLVDFRAAVQQDMQAALSGMTKGIQERDAKIAALEKERDELKAAIDGAGDDESADKPGG